MRQQFRAAHYTRAELVAIKLGLMDRIESMYGEDEKRLAPFNIALGKTNARIRIIDTRAVGKAINSVAVAANS
jgi:hypothetical protein